MKEERKITGFTDNFKGKDYSNDPRVTEVFHHADEFCPPIPLSLLFDKDELDNLDKTIYGK